MKQGWQPTKEELLEWLKGQVLCTFSTLDASGAPESATVAFSVTHGGQFLIGTSKDSHKAHNVSGDPRVAMTVTSVTDRYTAQIKGTAHILAPDEFEPLQAEHYRQRPQSLPFKDDPSQIHILVTPTQLRFSDVSIHPWLVTEYGTDIEE